VLQLQLQLRHDRARGYLVHSSVGRLYLILFVHDVRALTIYPSKLRVVWVCKDGMVTGTVMMLATAAHSLRLLSSPAY
jgi:hypothetical protein